MNTTPADSSNDPDQIRADIERTRAELGRDVDALAEKVSPTKAVSRQTDRVRSGLINVKENIMGSADDYRTVGHGHDGHADEQGRMGRFADAAGEYAHDAAEGGRHYAGEAQTRAQVMAHEASTAVQHAPAEIRRRTRGNPLAAGLVAFGAGMLLGSLAPSTRPEQRAAHEVKKSASPLVDEAKHAAMDLREQLEPEVRDAADSVKQTATEGGQHLKEQGGQAAGELKEQGRGSAEHVKDQAQN
ncbi:DUF3618 domain-containing protein [Micrococcus lylae]|uniref:DUF3618 domain-containing protein n=1 Tax=Micrococcus lylae TaxID=1273 RepID=UPI0021A51286|nr:DUF3618 domain-containing protein [Micrococcus lylae]MCT2008417.1 DUF3618 domain-containing protein [Micrococcus lylae]MCT2070397.1 DUF3618 domain-containing protein [Micrococcus lylae]